MPAIVVLRLKYISWTILVMLALLVALTPYCLEKIGVAPRQLGPHVKHRTSGHNPAISNIGDAIASLLNRLDRGRTSLMEMPLLRIGAQVREAPRVQSNGTVVMVASADEANKAITQAHPGDIITLMPGIYRFADQGYIFASHAGTQTAGITVRAERPNTVFLEFNLLEGFLVSAPYWTFENLTIRGVCKEQENCAHAFHVVAQASHFTARNNTIVDFNAHFKINSQDGFTPDNGLIEGNTLTNTRTRQTMQPVTPIDLVSSSHWVIRSNLITDFIKAQGDQISYGAYAKGAGADNLFERNIVLCEYRLHGYPGQRIGLSLGGGGTGKQYCRDKRCITEQDGGIIRSNLIASCSDEGIYINRAATSKIVHNTLIDTAGIMVRFVASSADVQANIVDGRIRGSEGAVLHASDNFDTSLIRLYLGLHPLRSLYSAPDRLDLSWNGEGPDRTAIDLVAPDLCGTMRPPHPRYGAFEDFSACRVK
jgi:hypothetical protein